MHPKAVLRGIVYRDTSLPQKTKTSGNNLNLQLKDLEKERKNKTPN